jgi:hypothetical protein
MEGEHCLCLGVSTNSGSNRTMFKIAGQIIPWNFIEGEHCVWLGILIRRVVATGQWFRAEGCGGADHPMKLPPAHGSMEGGR